MEKPSFEFLKLDEVDRTVILWLSEHVPHPNALKSWIEYIVTDYQFRKEIVINPQRLYAEAKVV